MKKLNKQRIFDIIYYSLLAVILFIVLFVAQRCKVNGESMYPTLMNGDTFIVDKMTYRFNDIERFDIIAFTPRGYDNDVYFVKRIIGLPGETIQINEEGNIFINDVLLDADLGLETMKFNGLASEPVTLHENEYFVLGDNRNNSVDSRFKEVGVVTKASIIGKAVFCPDHTK